MTGQQTARLMKCRAGLFRFLLLAAYCGLMVRTGYLQTAKVQEFRLRASQDRKHETELPAERGRILDRNGRVLAYNVEECTVFVTPRIIGDKRLAAKVIARHVGIPEEDVLSRLTSRTRRFVLARAVPVENAVRLRQELLALGPAPRINGVEVEHRSRRVYPLGRVGAKVIGALNSAGVPLAGVEAWADGHLRGIPGSLVADFDRTGRPIPTRLKETRPPRPGRDVVLTIDSRLQFAVEQALEKQVRKFGASSGSCIVLDPSTGEILALAEYPSFDPNRLKPEDVERRRIEPSTLTHLYEPGSTVKLFTAAAALEHGLTGVACRCTGVIRVGSATVRCPCSIRRSEPGAPVTVKRMLQYSCNTEAVTLARRMGSGALYRELEKFGLLDSVEVRGLGRTVAGRLPDPQEHTWSQMRLANVAFGQGVATSRMALTAAYAAVANGGFLLRPQLIREIRSPAGERVESYRRDVLGRVLEPAECARLKEYLGAVVTDGTGKNAAMDGVRTGGKTGSAQIPAPGGGGFEPGAFIASFCGLAPLDEPAIVALVTVERPKGSAHGSEVAAPVFREVAAKALWCVGESARSRAIGRGGSVAPRGTGAAEGFGGAGRATEG